MRTLVKMKTRHQSEEGAKLVMRSAALVLERLSIAQDVSKATSSMKMNAFPNALLSGELSIQTCVNTLGLNVRPDSK